MITIEFQEFTFDGLRINKYEEYPWTNKKEKKEFFKELLEGKADYNKDKFKRIVAKELKEGIHLDLSKSYISGICGLIVLGIMVLLAAKVAVTTLIVLGVISLTFILGRYIFRSKALSSYVGYRISPMFIDMFFEAE